MQIEGDGASRLLQLLRGDKVIPTKVTNAIVTQVSPIALRVFGEDEDTPYDAIILPEHLMDRTIEMRLKGSEDYFEYEIKSPLKVDDTVSIILADDAQLIYVIGKEVR